MKNQPKNIITMPTPDNTVLTDQDIINLFMGIVRLVRKQDQAEIKRLRAELNESGRCSGKCKCRR